MYILNACRRNRLVDAENRCQPACFSKGDGSPCATCFEASRGANDVITTIGSERQLFVGAPWCLFG